MADGAQSRLQREYFDDADEAHFRWQVAHPIQARREAELAGCVQVRRGERLLEIGCGEGANLHHLQATGAHRFGLDFSAARAAFARRATDAHTVTADAGRLPFAEGSFDAVLIRDLLHHVPDAAAVLAEARRVLRPGGRLTLIEPNRRSLLVLAQAALIRAERGVLRSSAARLRALVAAAGLRVVHQATAQPFPIERVLLHPDLGAPRLASLPGLARALAAADALARRLLPARSWMYLVFDAVRPEQP
jgi:ubiquinone/menaquinone biosynthesis C-methylase UbiE